MRDKAKLRRAGFSFQPATLSAEGRQLTPEDRENVLTSILPAP